MKTIIKFYEWLNPLKKRLEEIFCAIVIVLLVMNSVLLYSQEKIPWRISGNDKVGLKHFIGTINNQDFRIRTFNLQRMVITKYGLLGIGLTNPTEKLDVAGNARIRGKITADSIDIKEGFSLTKDK